MIKFDIPLRCDMVLLKVKEQGKRIKSTSINVLWKGIFSDKASNRKKVKL